MTIKNFLIIAVVGCFSLALTTAKGQNFQYANKLMEVSFSDPKVPRYISIRKDDNSAYFVAPHWTAAEKKPVAYVSGGHPNVGAKFKMSCKPRADVWVHGKNADGFNMKAQKLTFQSTDPTLGVYSPIESDGTFTANVVKFYPDFTIKWFVSDSESGTNAQEIGTSTNPLYVTFQELIPIADLRTPRASFYTLLHLGCKNAADLSDPSTIVDAMYKEFTDQQVSRVESPDQPMFYWGQLAMSGGNFCFNTAGLLRYGDARCGAWAKFLVDMIRTQGIKDAKVLEVKSTSDKRITVDDFNAIQADATRSDYTIITTENDLLTEERAMFFVKDWSITERTFTPNLSDNLFIQYDSYLAYSPIDVLGIPAQGVNKNPNSAFYNHAIVRYNNTIYDPSYGTPPRMDEDEWEFNALDGFGTYLDVQDNRDGSLIKVYWFRKNNNDSVRDTDNPFTIVNY